MTPEEIDAVRQLEARATPGPWRWNVNRVGQQVVLQSDKLGRMTVMDFVRFGMQRGQPRFQVEGLMETARDLATDVKGQEHNASHVADLLHPDARFIACAREAIPALLAHLDRTCTWTYEAEESMYETACGQAFTFNDGDAEQNGVVFCYHCGGKMVEVRKPEECWACEGDGKDQDCDGPCKTCQGTGTVQRQKTA